MQNIFVNFLLYVNLCTTSGISGSSYKYAYNLIIIIYCKLLLELLNTVISRYKTHLDTDPMCVLGTEPTLVFLLVLILLLFLFLFIGPKRGAQEGTTISKEMFPLHIIHTAWTSLMMKAPMGAAGGTS